MEGSTWGEEIVLSSEDSSGPLFLGGFHLKNGKVSGVCTIVKFVECDWGRTKDMVFAIKGGSGRDSSLTQALAPKKSRGGDCPDGGMEGVREVDTIVQSHDVLDGCWGTEGMLVSSTFLVSGGAWKLDPVVIAVPRCMVLLSPVISW